MLGTLDQSAMTISRGRFMRSLLGFEAIPTKNLAMPVRKGRCQRNQCR